MCAGGAVLLLYCCCIARCIDCISCIVLYCCICCIAYFDIHRTGAERSPMTTKTRVRRCGGPQMHVYT